MTGRAMPPPWLRRVMVVRCSTSVEGPSRWMGQRLRCQLVSPSIHEALLMGPQSDVPNASTEKAVSGKVPGMSSVDSVTANLPVPGNSPPRSRTLPGYCAPLRCAEHWSSTSSPTLASSGIRVLCSIRRATPPASGSLTAPGVSDGESVNDSRVSRETIRSFEHDRASASAYGCPDAWGRLTGAGLLLIGDPVRQLTSTAGSVTLRSVGRSNHAVPFGNLPAERPTLTAAACAVGSSVRGSRSRHGDSVSHRFGFNVAST